MTAKTRPSNNIISTKFSDELINDVGKSSDNPFSANASVKAEDPPSPTFKHASGTVSSMENFAAFTSPTLLKKEMIDLNKLVSEKLQSKQKVLELEQRKRDALGNIDLDVVTRKRPLATKLESIFAGEAPAKSQRNGGPIIHLPI